jgi:hypothetical protein
VGVVVLLCWVCGVNLPTIEGLVQFGLELGVSRFVLREVFYDSASDVVDHARMPELLLRPGEYAAMAGRLRERFGNRAAFDFADGGYLEATERKMRLDSLLPESVGREEPNSNAS